MPFARTSSSAPFGTVPRSLSAPLSQGGCSGGCEPYFAGDSAALRNLIRQIDRLAPFDHAHLLIEGESGTGKSFVARYLHARSPRAARTFHQVVLSTLDDNLAASDLFGHLSGSYTDARQSRPGHWVTANGGTLFLDEIGKASPAVQRKLLHAVEHNEVWPVGADRGVRLDVRLVAATNIPLDQLVAEGAFLPDLAARLTAFRIRMPSLDERREDIPALVTQFVALRAARCGHPSGPPAVAPVLISALQGAAWPNNLRQLDAVVQRLLIESAHGPRIGLEHCIDGLEYLASSRGGPLVSPSARAVRITPDIARARLAEHGSVSAAARSLGVSRWTIYRCLERAGQRSSDHTPSRRAV